VNTVHSRVINISNAEGYDAGIVVENNLLVMSSPLIFIATLDQNGIMLASV
jgi:hypothetical protein